MMHPRPSSPSSAAALFTALLLGFPAGVQAQAPADAAVKVDQVFAPWDHVDTPGCAVAVTQGGLRVLERAYGMADLEHGVPNTPQTVFEGGSLSKQFTAAAVILLALDGALSLDDDVRTYVPEVPDYGVGIPLRRLMTHTSGLRDWGSVAAISGWGREQRSHDHDDVLDIVSRQSALNFAPGHEYSYSNTGYNLLAIVVSRVSGMSFADFSRERIFQPLGMERTQWRDNYRRIVPGRSAAYDALPDGRWEINRPIEHVHGNGGILTTVGDLAIWAQALEDGRLGGAEFLAAMHETGRLSDGSPIRYAAGLVIGTSAGVPSVIHTGSTAGYRAFLGRYPEQELAVAMLCNAGNAPTAGNGGRVARVFLGDAARAPVPPQGVSVPAGRLEALTGLYRDPVTGWTRRIRLEDGVLRDRGAPLIPMSDSEFQVGADGPRFVFDRAGNRTTLHVRSWEYTDQRFEAVEEVDPDGLDLEPFAGTYHSADAETTFVIRIEDGRLVLWQRPGTTRVLEPVYEDGFRSGSAVVRFRRDAAGAVEALSLSVSRVYDMRFDRVEG